MTKHTATTPVAVPTVEASEHNRKMADVPANERKITLVKLLRKSRSTSATTAKSVSDLVALTGWSRFDVYGLINGTSGKAGSSPTCLVATGHVKVSVDETDGLSVYLTKAGSETKFTERPFAKVAPKAKAPAKIEAKAKEPAKKAKAKSPKAEKVAKTDGAAKS